MILEPKTALFVLALLACLIQTEKVIMASQIPNNAAISTYRQMIMQKNLLFISEQNKNKEYNVTVAPHPQMIALTVEQYKALLLQGKSSKKNNVVAPYLLPENKKLTLNVKDIYIYDLSVFDPVVYNQQRCGNSYAFATVGTINLNNRIWHPSVPRVSPQHHTDCSRSYGNSGCNGGNFISSYQFAMYTGIESEIAYPINASALQLGVNQACRDSPATNYKISSYGSVLAENPSSSLCMNRINVLYNLHSMSTSMYAGFSVFMFYSGGVFVGCPQGNSDHAVQMVGFYLDTTTGYSHFKIKNSFGTNWGIGGYFYMISQNLCHICENSYLSL